MPGGRVLMIAHHFPPAGGSGSNRALAFARYLPRYGWTPTVVTPGAAWAANRDDGLLAHVPDGVRVLHTPSLEGRARSRLANAHPTTRPATGSRGLQHAPNGRPMQPRLRGALRSHAGHLKRFPDAHVGWLPFALAAARGQAYDVVYSSSGPFTSHVVGLVLKRLARKPWVAELRDGWYRWNRAIFADYPAWRDALERRLEAAALRTADRVVLVTDRMAAAFRCQYTDLPADHFAVVPNGFDPWLLGDSASDSPHPSTGGEFEIVHSGALYYGRSIAALLEAAERLARAQPRFAQAMRLTLLGTLDAAARAELARSSMAEQVRVGGQVSHQASLAGMRAADLLLLVANTTPGAEATVPGKLFEYLAVGRPILAIAPRASSTTDVLERTGGAWVAPADDVAAIEHALLAAFEANRAGKRPRPDPTQVARFDRARLAGDLARIFDQVVANARARRI